MGVPGGVLLPVGHARPLKLLHLIRVGLLTLEPAQRRAHVESGGGGGGGVLGDLPCSPVAVVLWGRVGDVRARHQKQGPQQVEDAAGGHGEEGGAQRDSLFVQDLEGKQNEMMWVRYRHLQPVSIQRYLDDEEHCGGRVKGTVVEGDDGGAMSCKQVSHLHHTQRHMSGTRTAGWRSRLQVPHLHVGEEEENSTHGDAGRSQEEQLWEGCRR